MLRDQIVAASNVGDVSLLRTLALQLLEDRDRIVGDYSFLRSQNEHLLGTLRQLYENARREQVARATGNDAPTS